MGQKTSPGFFKTRYYVLSISEVKPSIHGVAHGTPTQRLEYKGKGRNEFCRFSNQYFKVLPTPFGDIHIYTPPLMIQLCTDSGQMIIT